MSEYKRDPKSIGLLSYEIEHLIDLYRNITHTNELFEYKLFIAEFGAVINECIDKYNDITDPITRMKTNIEFFSEEMMKNTIMFTKKRMIASGKLHDDSINESFYLVKHIPIEDIRRHKHLFVSNYYMITENQEEIKYIRDNIYIIEGDQNLTFHAFSEKYDYIYVPMGGVIHKVACVKDHRTEVIITYKDSKGNRKRLRIPEELLQDHNIYTSHNKALENGGQKESIEERMFILKIEELKRKHEKLLMSKITSERKSKIDLITKILKIIETEKDQNSIIKMLEIEKQTLANQNASLKNTKDGYEFIKTVARDIYKYV